MAPDQSLGDRMRELREARGIPQDELARVARQRGLSRWTRSTVAKIEAGQRELKAGELLLLPFILRVAFGDLLPNADFADLGAGASKVETKLLRRVIVGGIIPGPLPGPHQTPGRAEPAEAEEKAARTLDMTVGEVTNLALRLWDLSLTGERERRLIKQLRGRAAEPRTQQAIRGRITRRLMAELVQARKEKKR